MANTTYAPRVSTDEWISRHEAARRLGVSVQTVDRYWRERGVIRSRKNELTRRVTLNAADVERVRVEREEM